MSVRMMMQGRQPAAGGGGFDPDLPSTIAGLLMWHDASAITGLADNDAVTTWEDAHTTNIDLTQASSGFRPTYQTAEMNGLPVLRFDGSDDHFTNATAFTLKPVTVFAVVNMASVATFSAMLSPQGNGGFLWRITNSGAVNMVASNAVSIASSSFTLSTSTPTVIAASYGSAGAYAFYKNSGTAANTGTNNQTIESRALHLGADWNQGNPLVTHFNGDMAEHIVYDSVLSGSDITAVVDYLGAKWGITIT